MKKNFYNIVKEIYKPYSDIDDLNSSEGPAKEFNVNFKSFCEKIYQRNKDSFKGLSFQPKLDVSTLKDDTYLFFKEEIKKLFETYGFENIKNWIPSKKTNIDMNKLLSDSVDESEQLLHLQFIIKVQVLLLQILGKENPDYINIHYYTALSQTVSVYHYYYQEIRRKIIRKTQRLKFEQMESADKFFNAYLKLSLKAGKDLFPKDSNSHYLETNKMGQIIYSNCTKKYRKNPNQDINKLIQNVTNDFFNKQKQKDYNE